MINKKLLENSRIINFLRNINSKIDEIYSLSITKSLNINIIEWFKMVFKNSILRRIIEINEIEEKDFFSESLVLKKTKYILYYLKNKLEKLLEERFFANIVIKLKSETKNINCKHLGYIIIIAILTNLFLNIVFTKEINYFFLVLKSGIFLGGIFLIFCDSDLNSIIKNSSLIKNFLK